MISELCAELGIEKYSTLFKIDQLPHHLPVDALRFPYWELDTNGVDVDEYFQEGKVSLNHKLCPISIVLTIDMFRKVLTTATYLKFDEYFPIEEKIMDELQAESDVVEATGKLAPGYMFNLGVADGSAIYKVTKVTPKSVTVEIRDHGDNYRDRFLGCGHKLSKEDFNRISGWTRPALFGRG